MARLTPTLRSARLTLRPLRAGDAEAIVTGVGNYSVVRWLSSPPYPYSEQAADAFIRETTGKPVWAIDDGDGLKGVIGADGDLGYWLARDCWGRGYATEAGDAVVDAWFSGSRATELRSNHYVGNDASAHVLRKLGFVDSGERLIRSIALSQNVAARQMTLSRERWQERRTYRLRTMRLRLREVRDSDLPAIRRIGGDPRVARMLGSVPHPWPEDHAGAWLKRAKYMGRPGFRAAICTRWGRLIGTVAISSRLPEGHYICGWFLDPRYWGRGYATKIVGAFLTDVMERFAIDDVQAQRFADNPASGRVMEKLGFVKVGTDMSQSAARLEPAPVVIYRLERSNLKVPR